ncbi:MAG TPA: sugar ABC transporter permease [Gaiella sp.]|nr:sugar ABC transporter permease [Gaiella sp.]HET9288399.1 sugar ABC transporter permease [Gaiella sp.]
MTERRQLALMLAPYAVGLAALVAFPAVVTVALAFTEYDLVRAPELVGLANFRELVHDDVFRIALVNSLVFAAIATPLRLLAALGLALLLHRRFRGGGAARAAVILPTVVPEVAFGLLWLWLFNPISGPVNGLLTAGGANGETVLGRLPPQWLTDPNHARAGVILMSLFTIGEGFVILLVARRAIPSDLYELAALEDATWWDVFRRITLPVMAPALALLCLRDLVLGLQTTFVPSLVVWDGGPPDYGTTYLGLFAYRNAFEYLRYGYAAAATVVMLLLTATAVVVQLWAIRRWSRRAVTPHGA